MIQNIVISWIFTAVYVNLRLYLYKAAYSNIGTTLWSNLKAFILLHALQGNPSKLHKTVDQADELLQANHYIKCFVYCCCDKRFL